MTKRISITVNPNVEDALKDIQQRTGMNESESAQYAMAVGLTKTQLQEKGKIVYEPEDGSPKIVLGDENGNFILDKFRRR
jgi:hypothetical protein